MLKAVFAKLVFPTMYNQLYQYWPNQTSTLYC